MCSARPGLVLERGLRPPVVLIGWLTVVLIVSARLVSAQHTAMWEAPEPSGTVVSAVLDGGSHDSGDLRRALVTGSQTENSRASPLTIGTRVRVRSTILPIRFAGPVVTLDEKVLTVDGGGGPLNIPLDSIEVLELSLGRKRQWLKGLGAGALAGFGLGFAYPVDPRDCDADSPNFCSRGEAVGASTFVFAAIGAAIGALFKADRWALVDAATLTQVADKNADTNTPTGSSILRGNRQGVAMSLRF